MSENIESAAPVGEIYTLDNTLGDAGNFVIRVQCADVALQAFGTVVFVFYY